MLCVRLDQSCLNMLRLQIHVANAPPGGVKQYGKKNEDDNHQMPDVNPSGTAKVSVADKQNVVFKWNDGGDKAEWKYYFFQGYDIT